MKEEEWIVPINRLAEVKEYVANTFMLFTKVNSWFMGINSNIEGRDQRRFLLYAAGLPTYREKAEEVVAGGYDEFVLS